MIDRLSTLLIRGTAFLVGLLSWRHAQRVGAVLGLIWFYLVPIRRRVVIANLLKALPRRRSEHRAIARSAYRHFGISATEFLKITRMSKSELVGRVHHQGMEHFERAYKRGRGVIVVTGHFGNFDLLACAQAARGVPLAIVSRDLRGAESNQFWMESRQGTGLKIFPDHNAALPVLRWLRKGNVLGLTVDQRTAVERGGILSDFMGWQVWTTTAPAALALRWGAALLPVHVERRSDGDHDLIVEPEIPLPDQTDNEGIQILTSRINQIVASWVHSRPDHWMWLHRRFDGGRKKSV